MDVQRMTQLLCGITLNKRKNNMKKILEQEIVNVPDTVDNGYWIDNWKDCK